jgi:HPt (histidine-containing phosphotransfer) domain-containing protein
MDLKTLAILRSLDSDPRAFAKLVDGYLADARRDLADLAVAVAAGDVPTMVRVAHGQLGAARTMGLSAFATSLALLETAAQTGVREAQITALAAVEHEFQRATAVLASVRGA